MVPNPGGGAPRLKAGQQRRPQAHVPAGFGSEPGGPFRAEAGPQPLPSGRHGSRFRNPEAPEAPSAFAGLFEGRRAQLPLPHWTRPAFPTGRSRPSRGPWPQDTTRRRAALSAEGEDTGRGRGRDGRSPTAAAAAAARGARPRRPAPPHLHQGRSSSSSGSSAPGQPPGAPASARSMARVASSSASLPGLRPPPLHFPPPSAPRRPPTERQLPASAARAAFGAGGSRLRSVRPAVGCPDGDCGRQSS